MTKEEYNEAAALVVRLRKELEHTNQHLVAHIDALTKSNAQCGEYLRQNEQLHSLLQTVSAQRDDLQMAKDDITNALAETTKDLAYSRLAVDTMRARDTRFTETIAKCGAAAGEDIGDFIESAVACRDQFHRELVEVRAALAATTEQRDSLRSTLAEWERADTKPHERVAADDVADHVVPPVPDMCMTCHGCGSVLEPDSREEYNEAAALVVRLRKELEDATQDLSLHYDALKQSNAQCGKLLVQNEQLTAELDRMKGDPLPIKLVGKLKDAEDSNKTLHSELVEVRSALASVTEQRDSLRRTLNEWERGDTKPHARIDPPIRMGFISETGPVVFVRIGPKPAADDVADHVVPPVIPLCNVCHGCGMPLGASAKGPYLWCTNFSCNRKTTQYQDHDASPYWGPCKSATPVRHE